MERDQIHPQLLKDCHCLGRLPYSWLLLHRNAALPWFILLPHTELEDVLDLPDELRAAVVGECALISTFLKQELGYSKVNFAGIGNLVPQMHLHVIGRRQGDACWPQPVWGNLEDGPRYKEEQLLQWQTGLAGVAGLEWGAAGCP